MFDPEAVTVSDAALAGIRVVDLAGTVSTGYCGKLFADYGAEVINVERPEGFPTRQLGPFVAAEGDCRSAMHAYLSTNKKSVLWNEATETAVDRLVGSAQLVLDAGDHPFVDCCHGIRSTIAWYGEGPYQEFTGSDAQMFALNGMLRNIGEPGDPPLIPTGYQAQVIGGLTGYVATLTEILGRELGNVSGPAHIETSIFEAMLCFTEVGVVSGYNTGIEASRMGINRFPPTYPLGVFPCRDGWLGVSVLTPLQWRSFCKLLDLDDLVDVPLFQTSVGRLQALDVIEPLFCEKLLGHSAENLFYRGQAARIPLARVPTMEELFGVDQFLTRRAFAEALLPGGSSIKVPSVPFRLYATPPHFGGKIASPGQHTGELL